MRQAGLAYLASCNYTQHTISSIESKTRLKFLAQEHEVVFNLLTSPAGKHAGARVFAEIKDDFRYDYRYPDSARSAMIEMDIAVEGDVPAPAAKPAPKKKDQKSEPDTNINIKPIFIPGFGPLIRFRAIAMQTTLTR
jgi:hypothetical protein